MFFDLEHNFAKRSIWIIFFEKESEILIADKAEAKSEVIDPSELAYEAEASITAQDEINSQPKIHVGRRTFSSSSKLKWSSTGI